jgi:hypothetical protein
MSRNGSRSQPTEELLAVRVIVADIEPSAAC